MSGDRSTDNTPVDLDGFVADLLAAPVGATLLGLIEPSPAPDLGEIPGATRMYSGRPVGAAGAANGPGPDSDNEARADSVSAAAARPLDVASPAAVAAGVERGHALSFDEFIAWVPYMLWCWPQVVTWAFATGRVSPSIPEPPNQNT